MLAGREQPREMVIYRKPPLLWPLARFGILVAVMDLYLSVASMIVSSPTRVQALQLTLPRTSHLNRRTKGTTVTMEAKRTLVVVGGGAAGYFGSIQAAASASSNHVLKVFVLEAGRLPLSKVKISGGGRCNVMHDVAKSVSVVAQGYPRGRKQLIGPFKSLFGPADAAEWFRSRGVDLKTESDGRMFPITDDSQTIIDCLEGAARDAGVEVITSAKVTSIVREETNEYINNGGDDCVIEREHMTSPPIAPSFEVTFTTTTPLSPSAREALHAVEEAAAADEKNIGDYQGPRRERGSYRVKCDYVLQATGASREGHAWAESLGHEVSRPVPSLFTLTIKDPRLEGLSGLSVQDVELKLVAEDPQAPATKPIGNSGNSSEQSRDGVGEGGVIGMEGGEGGEKRAANEVKKKKRKKRTNQSAITQRGPLLITHTGISGPAALKLSAFGARELSDMGYKAKLMVNWVAGNNASKALEELQAFRTRNPKKTVYAFCPISGDGGGGNRSQASHPGVPRPEAPPPASSTPRRLWHSLALAAGVGSGDKWADVSNAKLSTLARELTACELQVLGKGSFKEEFVTCGGVSLSAIDMRTMQSRTVLGLFFAGEVVDVDGVTGGYNFQSAWTTGWVAGSAIGASARLGASSPAEEVPGDGQAMSAGNDDVRR